MIKFLLIVFSFISMSFESFANDNRDNKLSQSNYIWDSKKSTVSPVEFNVTNYGLFPYYYELGRDYSIKWPRGTGNVYMFSSGFWFGAQKFHPDSGKMMNYVSISFNPNNGRSWYTPGRIEDGLDIDTSSLTKYRLYMSTSFDKITGKPLNQSDGANWPLWNYVLNQNNWLLDRNHFVYDTTKRNMVLKPYGPVFASDEDIFCTYKDSDLSRYDDGPVNRSQMGYPLGLQIDQRILSWDENHPLKDCIIIQYNITNMSDDSLKNCFFGALQEIEIGVKGMKTNWAANDYLRQYEKNPSLNLMIGWTGTDQGEDGMDFGYVGSAFIETPTTNNKNNIRTDSLFYNPSSQLGLNGTRLWAIEEEVYKDNDRYVVMSTPVFDSVQMPKDYRMLMTTGPFNLYPNQTVRLANLITFSLPCNDLNADGTDSDLECENGLIAKVKRAYEFYYNGLTSNVNDNISKSDNLFIIPNPAGDNVEINNVILRSEANDPVVVYDLLGIIWMDSRFRGNDILISSEGNVRIDISSLSPGVYFVRVGGRMYKFVKM